MSIFSLAPLQFLKFQKFYLDPDSFSDIFIKSTPNPAKFSVIYFGYDSDSDSLFSIIV